MSNRQGVTYDADNLVNLTPGSLTYNGSTYDVAASGSAAAAQATANAALTAAAAAQATANAALPKAGGTMTGNINMSGTQKVTNLAAPTVATDAATKGYVDTSVVGLLDLKGTIDCSANPNYPAASKGDVYVVSVAGLIGGGAGIAVQAGDALVALADNAGGTQAAVGSSWSILQANLIGALLAANNLSDVQNVTTARNNLGLGTAATYAATAFAQVSNNLSDLTNAGSARTNLGLGTAATQNSTAFATAAQGTLASTAVQRAGDTMTGALGINRSGGAINATDLHIGAGNISIDGAVSTRLEPVVASPGNYARTLTFHPKYTGNTGVNAIALQTLPEVGAGAVMPLLYGMISAFIGSATKWIGIAVLDGGGTATTKYDAILNGGGNVGIGTDTPTARLHIAGSTKLGTNGTALTQVVVYTPTLTPAAVGSAGFSTQTFTVTGLTTADTVTVNGPAATALSALVSFRVSAADTLSLTWFCQGALTPASGTYRIVAIRS